MVCSIYMLVPGRQNMVLEFTKEKDGDDYLYGLSYGNLFLGPSDGTRRYSVRGAYLWEEKSGELQEFIDRIISEASYIERLDDLFADF